MDFSDSDSEDDAYHGTKTSQKQQSSHPLVLPSIQPSNSSSSKPVSSSSSLYKPKDVGLSLEDVNQSRQLKSRQNTNPSDQNNEVEKLNDKLCSKIVERKQDQHNKVIQSKYVNRKPKILPQVNKQKVLDISPSNIDKEDHSLAQSLATYSDSTAGSAVGRVVWTPIVNTRAAKALTSINNVTQDHENVGSSGSAPSMQDNDNRPVDQLDRLQTDVDILRQENLDIITQAIQPEFIVPASTPRLHAKHSPTAAYTPELGKVEMSEPDSGSNVASTSMSERVCIRLFGISYHEIISKLVMEAHVLSEAESRMVLLILSETEPQHSKIQKKMLDAVITIEKHGISKSTVTTFRKELASVASILSKQDDMVEPLAVFDVRLSPVRRNKSESHIDDLTSPASLELEVGNELEEVTGSDKLDSPRIPRIRDPKLSFTGKLVPVLSQVMHKVASRLSSNQPSNRRQVILVASGAYNPIHKLHLRMLYIARKYLEERTDYDVLGGLVSPAHATEVRTRYRQQPLEIIPPKHRLAMARCAVGDSTWLTVDPWEITRKRVMDYMSVLEHVTQLIDVCFPGLNVKIIYLCNSDVLMKLCPESLRSKGFGCLCVCRPQETDRLLHHMGSRWKNVAYVVEDAAILSRELEATTSTRVRACAIEENVAEVRAMVGVPVARYISKYSLGAKMSGKERWTNMDKKFELFSGLDVTDMGYQSEAKNKQKVSKSSPGYRHGVRFDVL